MEILSWNIQYSKGVDDVRSVSRIASDIKTFADPDIICLQEVLRTPEDDQVRELAESFPEHECVFGAAINRLYPSGRLEFGNVILSKLPILQILQHKLPQPPEPECRHMPRQAIELIVVSRNEFLRVVTLHLDFHAAKQRSAQVRYLSEHHQENTARYHAPSPEGGEEHFASMPETSRTVYCGDFNLTVDSTDYRTLTTMANGTQLIDCWRHLYNDTPHAPTCGIFDRIQWEEGPHCRDFFFVSPDVAENVQSMEVETTTAASDHQPIKLTLN